MSTDSRRVDSELKRSRESSTSISYRGDKEDTKLRVSFLLLLSIVPEVAGTSASAMELSDCLDLWLDQKGV